MSVHAPSTVEDRWTHAAGVALRVRCYDPPDEPTASAVVLHGLVTGVDPLRSARAGLDPFARLAGEGLAVAALDWPGHGRSGGRRGALSYRGAMDAIAAAVELAQNRWPGPVGLVGLGLGGALALYGGIEDRRIGAVVAHGAFDLRDVSAVPTRGRGRHLAGLVARLRRQTPGGFARRVRVPARWILAPGQLAGDPGTAARLWRNPQAVRAYPLEPLAGLLFEPADKPDLAASRAPALLAAGTADPVQPPAAVRRVSARLSGPHRTWLLPGGGHQLLVDHPEASIPAFAAFLREHLA